MYATNGLNEVLGVSSEQLIGRSFYYCIQENCLREAVKCLESAKANDSIAYLRFWFRDPTTGQQADPDDHMSDGQSTADEDEGGVHLSGLISQDRLEKLPRTGASVSLRSSVEPGSVHSRSNDASSRSASGNSTDVDGNGNDTLFDQPAGAQSSASSLSMPEELQTQSQMQPQPESWQPDRPQIELEAVVSCTSDGLVVVLRAARPLVPQVSQAVHEPVKHPYENGFFAVPWGSDPMLPDMDRRSRDLPDPIRPPRLPISPTAAQPNIAAVRGPSTEAFMNTIREVAVFAWSLTGINGSLARYGRGTPSGESQPPGGLPVWDPYSNAGPERPSAIPRTPSNFPYSPLDGTPLFDRMEVDSEMEGQTCGERTGGDLYTSAAPVNSFSASTTGIMTSNARVSIPHYAQTNGLQRSAVSINDFAVSHAPNGSNAQHNGSQLPSQKFNATPSHSFQSSSHAHGQQMGAYASISSARPDQVLFQPDQHSQGMGVGDSAGGPPITNAQNGFVNGGTDLDYTDYSSAPFAASTNAYDKSSTGSLQTKGHPSNSSTWHAADTLPSQSVNGPSRWS